MSANDKYGFEVHVEVTKAKHLVDKHGIRRRPGANFVYEKDGEADERKPFSAWPVVQVECLGEVQYTDYAEESDSPIFDRHFVFKKEWDEVHESGVDITLQQFAKKNISFKILDASTWRRDLVLGEYTLNVEDIMKDERAVPPLDAPPGTSNGAANSRITGSYGTALRNTWLCLHEPVTVAKSARMRGAGFLQVSVTILKKVPNGVLQKLPPLPLPLTNLQRFLQAAYIMPVPEANFSSKGIMPMESELMELVVRVFKAEDIPLSKKKGANSPYVRVLFNGHGNTNDTFLQLEDYDRSSNLSHRKGQQASQYPTLAAGSYTEMQERAPGRGALGADTNIAQSGPNPVWNQEVRIPFTTYDEYTVLENVAVQLRDRRHTASTTDEDKVPDHLLATHRMSLNNVKREPRPDDVGGGWGLTWDSGVNYKDVRKVLPAPFWINFYGSQDAGMQSLLEAQMNEGNDMDGSVVATDYKGRLLVQMFVERVKKDPDEGASTEPVAENDRVRYFVNLENEKDTSSDIGQAFGQKSGEPKRRTVTVTCNRIDTVRDIIKAIDQQHPSLHGIADPSTINFMELSFDGERLEPNAIMTKDRANRAKKPDERDGSSPLSLKWPPGKIQRLNIRMPSGVEQDSTISLYMARPGEGSKGVKVSEFKKRLSKRIGHKAEMFDLAYGESMLSDDDELDKLRNNDVMYLHWKIRLRHAEWSDQMYADVNRPAYYTMKLDLFQGQGFPEKVKGYELYVKTMIGNQTFPGKAESEPRKVKKSTNGMYNFVQWGQSFEIPWLRLPAQDAELPDVMIYVYQREITDDVAARKPVGSTKDTRLGFLRLSVKNKAFPFNQRDPIWMPLTPDRLSPAWNEQLVMRDGPKLCGSLQFRLQFGARTEGSQHVVGVTRQLEWNDQLNQGLGANAPQRRTETLGDVARQYRVNAKEVLDLNRDNLKGKVKAAVLERFERLVKQGGSGEETELKNDVESAKCWKAIVPAFFEALWRDDHAAQPQSPQECAGFQQQSGQLAQAFKRLKPNERKFVWFKMRKLLYNPRESEPLFNQVQLLQGEKLDVPSKLLTESQTAQAGRLKAPETHKYELRCYVYQAQDLPVQNDLLPDPYVEIHIGPKMVKTKPVTKSAYPVFNQMLQIDDVELNLNPGNENHTDFLKNINDYSRFAEYITVKVKDADPLVDDTTLGRFEVRLAEVDIVRNADYQRWERTQKLAEAKFLLDPNENPPPNWTKAALQQYLAKRKGPYDKKFKESNEEPLRNKEAMPTDKDWWPVIPVRDEMGREVRIRDDDYDMLSSRELRTRAQGQVLVWFQLLHKDRLKENTHHINLADECGKEITHKTTRNSQTPATLNANSSEKELLDWWERLERKPRKDDVGEQPGPGDWYRRAHPAQVMAELVPPPRFDTIAPPGHNCMIEYQVFGVKDLKPVNGRPLERPYVEVDTGSLDDPTKRMRTKKVKVLMEEQADTSSTACAIVGGSYANHLETLRVQVRVPESLLFSPTFQIRVYDFRDGGTNKVLVGSAAVPMAKFLPETWICRNKRLSRSERLEYVHDWSIKSPLYRRLEVLALDKSQTQMAKDAFHAELLNDLAVQKFKSIQVGDQELDPSMLDDSSRKGPHRERFRRNMRVAQLAYMSNWEEQQLEDDQALKDIMGADRFDEYKSIKAKKRALGGFHSLQDAMPDDDSSYLSSMVTDRVSGTTNPTSMFFDREEPDMDNVQRSLMPQAPRVAGRGGNPTAPIGGRTRPMRTEMRRGLLDDVDRTVSGFQSLKPADVYGRGAQFDPETGYPINQKTGYAFDPVMMMDIDPITHYFLDRKVKLPIDPKTGFCFNRFNGFMYDPESGRAVIFNHREQFVRLEPAKNSQLESMVMQEQQSERLRKQVLSERDLDQDGLRLKVDGRSSAVSNSKLMNHRRIGCDFEAENEFRPTFQTIPLFRDREGCPRDRKTNVGNVKLNFSITETQRRYEDPLPRQLKRMYPTKLYTVRVYVLHGYDMMGTVVKGKLDRSLQAGLDDASGDGDDLSADWQAQDGDHCNLYLRLRCGNKVVYDSSSSGTTDVGEDDTLEDKLINVHWNTSNPDFYCCLTLDVALPGVSDMFVEVWDHPLREKDPANPRPEVLSRSDKKNPSSLSKIYGSGLHSNNRGCDQLVGWTKIDVEDRLHDSKWKTLESKPIEKRKLWAPTSKHPQGQLEMIVDILPCDKAQYALPLPIETMCPKPLPFELRCIVWKVDELDFRGDYWRKLNDSNPTARLRLPTHMNMDDVNRKNFYVRATFKDFDIARSPNYLWHASMKSDTHFDVSANSDKGPYLGEMVQAPLPQKHPLQMNRGSTEYEWARVKKRNGDGSYVLVYYEGQKNEFEYKTDLNNPQEKINNPSTWRRKVPKGARGGIRKKASVTVNWRFCWKVNLPCNDPRLHLCVRDRREKKKWCEATVNLADIFRLARRTQRAVCYERERSTETANYVSGQGDGYGGCGPDAFCLKLKHPNHRDTQGLMYCSFEVLPEAESYIRRAGQGRNKPNNLEVGKISTPSRLWDAFCFFFRRLFCSHRWVIFWFVVFVLVIAIIAKCLE